MRVGYAQVSTQDQNLDLQEDALRQAGCTEVFRDVVSGATADRNGLQKALEFVHEGDVLVVWRLDRLGRSLKHLIELMSELEKKEVGFCSLQESINTASPGAGWFFICSVRWRNLSEI